MCEFIFTTSADIIKIAAFLRIMLRGVFIQKWIKISLHFVERCSSAAGRR
ncbi:hypothetical protein CIT292_07672 [Citrobacter youngae ATCC 29220]|uniref:Uncharacterized protein n=1 Tax=Citrobacter youngae ATCC 29220 TaxID=500640 RepID=D4BB25_9ENTR|nr:hypothetical protein CIT292_07672 [Citrobacter youngae ATCC 29220]